MGLTLKDYTVCLCPFSKNDSDDNKTIKKVKYGIKKLHGAKGLYNFDSPAEDRDLRIYLDSTDQEILQALSAVRKGGHLIINAHGKNDRQGLVVSAMQGGARVRFSDVLTRLNTVRGAATLNCYVYMMVCYASDVRGVFYVDGNWKALCDMKPWGVYSHNGQLASENWVLSGSANLGSNLRRDTHVKWGDLEYGLKLDAVKLAIKNGSFFVGDKVFDETTNNPKQGYSYFTYVKKLKRYVQYMRYDSKKTKCVADKEKWSYV
ncbi:hypothetical protein ACFL6M_04260 [Candidatus Eisenbacteria bacterium]|uniref:Phospholipase D-like domain-containing protein n=1 Tax=Eiseniibacteriota bacterium TaxID=2212470 RepID=A0ABV6YKD1_UNCEI